MKKVNFYTEDPQGFNSSVFFWSRRNFPRAIKHRDKKRAHRRGQCWKQNKCRPFIHKIYRETVRLSRSGTVTLTKAMHSLSGALNQAAKSSEELCETLNKFANQP